MSLNKYIFNSMKKYRFISPMKEKEFEAKAAIHRKKWKAKMFLQSSSFFDEQNPKCGWEDNDPVISMPQSKEDVKKYFQAYERHELDYITYSSLQIESKIHQEIYKLPENVQIYIAGLNMAIESGVLNPWEGVLSRFFYTQHEWDLFLILDMLKKTSDIHGIDDGPWPLYWFQSRELLFEALHRYPDLIKNTVGRSLPLRIWDQKDFVKGIVAVNFELFKSAPRHIKESRDKVLEAAKVDGRIIGFIKTNMRNDPEVAMTAVNSHADAKDYLFKKTRNELGLI
jgi:5'(3')-deoxyribonucleotidase